MCLYVRETLTVINYERERKREIETERKRQKERHSETLTVSCEWVQESNTDREKISERERHIQNDKEREIFLK